MSTPSNWAAVLLVAFASAACGGAEPLPVRPRPPDAPPPQEEARCGPFADLQLSASPLSLLGGRLRIRTLSGSEIQAAEWAEGVAAPATEETRVVLEVEDERFVILVNELFFLAGEEFGQQVGSTVASFHPDALPAIEALDVEGLDALAVVPTELDTESEQVFVLGLYVARTDRTVQALNFYVSPGAAAGGTSCVQVARSVANTLAAGARQLQIAEGQRRMPAFERDLSLEAPSGYVLTSEHAEDHFFHTLYKLAPLGTPRSRLQVYVGRQPRWTHEERGATTLPRRLPLLGARMRWHSWSTARGEEGRIHYLEGARRISVRGRPERWVRVLAQAADTRTLEELEGIIRTLQLVDPLPRPPAPEESGAREDEPTAAAPADEDE